MPIDPEAAGFAPEKLDRLTHHLESRYVTPKKIAGCSLRIVRKGITAHDSTLGLMDIERDKPMRTDTIFRIYSMTKPLTSVALMMLFEEGQLQLTDPVYKFIPSWRQHRVWVEGTGDAMATRRPVTPMTIQHLLSHTAGLTYGGFLPGLELPVDPVYAAAGISRAGTDTLEEFVQKLSQVPLLYEPGSQWSYSLATDVCGHLIEVISGKPLEEFLRERLFEPLDMPDTGFSVPDHKLDRFAACYERAPDKSLRLQDDPETSRFRKPPHAPSGAGGLVGTTGDYAHFSEMLVNQGQFRGRQLIGRPTLDLMTRNHLGGSSLAQMAVGGFSETSNDGVGFGLGFASTIDAAASGTVGEGDFYWGGLASTLFWVDPIEELYAIFMAQLIPSSTFNFRGQIKSMVYGALKADE
ncbi:MAG: serine hydrolase [Halieaceae bacterium]|nr:serine hydrolase [Halieaceae bacterium]|tara:strand:- start:125 stop:1351 length:1227 start_codon:yes stop_codon:yes gene_type:complete